MKIQKRDGTLQNVSFNKIVYRLKKLCNDKDLGKLAKIDQDIIAQRVVSSLYEGMSSIEIDEEAARIAISLTDNREFAKLASRIIISNLHKNTIECFSEVMEMLNRDNEIIKPEILEIIKNNKDTIDFAIDYKRDYLFDYFGYKTLEKSYLMKTYNRESQKMVLVERPQHLYMRVALAVHLDDIPNVLKTYELLSQHYFTFASPTLFNGGTKAGNLSSCFLLPSEIDSLEGIFKNITDTAKISKLGGGIGVSISDIRAKGSLIKGTNGISDGIVPMLKTYNSVSCYINQSGKRKGSFAMYLSPWHADVLDFLELRKNNGSEDMRARDLFYAMWISDEFMKAVESDADWYLMCPNECPRLTETFGDEFKDLYWNYVAEGKFRRKIKAQEIWTKILESQIETGNPYITYKDAINKKSNQKNIGVIKSSNLCSEISLVSTSDRYSCCNLASIALPKYVEYNKGKPFINFEKLHEVAKYIILGMNRVIDNNVYPTPETELSNMENRPLGIGIQGENHLFIQMRVAFDSPEARQINKEVFECIYHGCLEGSMELAKTDGSYSTFRGSPFSQGMFQFDLAQATDNIDLSDYLSDRYNWDLLRDQVKQYGIRNSMLTACMPTASSAQILGNSESFDPIDSCIYKRRVLSGEYIIINKYLVDDLIELKLWNKEMKETIILNNGSIQSITNIPENIRVLYKTCWELSMKAVIDLAADRQVFVDQMQSMNLFVKNPSFAKLTSMHFYGWKQHLKTGMYYLRSTTNSSAAKFSVNPELEQKLRDTTILEDTSESDCLACSS